MNAITFPRDLNELQDKTDAIDFMAQLAEDSQWGATLQRTVNATSFTHSECIRLTDLVEQMKKHVQKLPDILKTKGDKNVGNKNVPPFLTDGAPEIEVDMKPSKERMGQICDKLNRVLQEHAPLSLLDRFRRFWANACFADEPAAILGAGAPEPGVYPNVCELSHAGEEYTVILPPGCGTVVFDRRRRDFMLLDEPLKAKLENLPKIEASWRVRETMCSVVDAHDEDIADWLDRLEEEELVEAEPLLLLLNGEQPAGFETSFLTGQAGKKAIEQAIDRLQNYRRTGKK